MIQKGDFIKLTYTGQIKDENGEIFDTTDEQIARDNDIYDDAYSYNEEIIIVGAGYALEGLEEDVIGKEVGYSGAVSIPPEKGFGEYDPELIKSYNINQFKEKPEVGAMAQIDGKYGTVHRVIGRRVQVDFNNLLSNETLYYAYKIEEKIEDELEKIKRLMHLYTKETPEVDINNSTATMDVPIKISQMPQWTVSKRKLAEEIIKYTTITEVIYTETYTEDNIKTAT